jgi:tRNA uridine 5-carbamoylmethylation protein Kti12
VIKDNFLICLAGLPASGKTTFANMMMAFIEKELSPFKVKIIDPDIIRNSLTSEKFDPSKERLVRKNNLEDIENALTQGFIVISDDLNYYSSMRHDLKEISERVETFLFTIYISTPIEICLKWNDLRGKPIPNNVINEIHKKFDNFNRYKWDHPIMTIDMSLVQDLDIIVEEVMRKISARFNILKSIKLKSRKKETSKIIYVQELDRITRDIVGELLKDRNFHITSKKISKYRRTFIKQYSKNPKGLSKIPDLFRKYLEQNLNK